MYRKATLLNRSNIPTSATPRSLTFRGKDTGTSSRKSASTTKFRTTNKGDGPIIKHNDVFRQVFVTIAISTALAVGAPAFAGKKDKDDDKSYTLSGACAFLPADRATEFHGNPDNADLRLGMAGNQWVVFDKALQQFNIYIGERDVTDAPEPAHRDNPGWNLADLNQDGNRIYTQLIPPGQIRNQIKSGCMILGNDEERNFLPQSVQVNFDVFASTNYNLMQDLANNGFIDEAVPYIKNKLDLMVASGNATSGKQIGSNSYTGDPDFDKQFDIIMDLLSSDIITSNLDHINEGIHNAANTYMGAAHDFIRANDRDVYISEYHDAQGYIHSGTKPASEWIQIALKAVATPLAGSPGSERLVSRDAGENHDSHDLVARGCVYAGDNTFAPDPTYKFCEYSTLNKANTHESRVHHVETPNGIQGNEGYVPVDVGFVWITELAYVLAEYGGVAGVPAPDSPVEGMVGLKTIGNLGIPTPASDSAVNAPATYSLALLATSEKEERGNQFIEFLRATEGQTVYTNGGFTGLTVGELAGGKCYSDPRQNNGVSIATNRADEPGGKCPDWLGNGSF